MSWNEGDLATVIGLQGRAELNGRVAVVTKGKWPNSKKRIGVRVQGDTQSQQNNKPLSLKALNLKRVEGEDAKAAARMLLDGNAAAAKPNAGQLKTDAEIAKDVVDCVGTFRWREDKVLPSLPTAAAAAAAAVPPPAKHGWAPWLQWRCPDNPHAAVQLAQSDPCLLDGLSFPLSLCFALGRLGMSPEAFKLACSGGSSAGSSSNGEGGAGEAPAPRPKLTVLVLGATVSAEQRLVYDSDYWTEFTSRYPFADIHLVMVGPECDDQFLNNDTKKGRREQRKARLGANGTVEAVHGVLRPLLEARPELAQWQYANDATRSARARPGALRAATVAVGFNPGFGSGSPGLVKSWADDLQLLAETQLPVIFTQANDYSDVRGELAVLRNVVGTRFVLAPTRSPYHMATTTVDEEGRNAWCSGNSFVYAWQGLAQGKKSPVLNLKDGARVSRTLGALEAALQAAEKEGAAGMGDVQIGIDKSELGVFAPPRVRWTPSAESVAKSAAWNVAKLATGQIDEAAAVAAAIAAGPATKTAAKVVDAAAAAAAVNVDATLELDAVAAAELEGMAHIENTSKDRVGGSDGATTMTTTTTNNNEGVAVDGNGAGLSRVTMPADGSAGLDSMYAALSSF